MVRSRMHPVMLLLTACIVALTPSACMVDQSGFELIQRYPIDMGYGLHIQDVYLYATTNDGIELFEMNFDGRLTHLQSIEIGSSSFAVVARGNIVYVGGEGGLTVVETPSASTSRILGKHDTGGSIYSLSLLDSLLYMTDYHKGLNIADISDPANPVMIGHLQLRPGSWDHEIVGVTIDIASQTITTVLPGMSC
ncbi:MAG: hypothetical protein JSU65_00355 [Candidatus Zixiibacteriota bacterium]|nr:MAG: hypothetical protein JSU65_00355 [candidate division Zixibacteria bacterium]